MITSLNMKREYQSPFVRSIRMTTTDYTLDGSSIVVTVNEDETYDGTAASNWHGYSIWKDEETDEEENNP
jgi:hypothetical protein